MKKLLAPLLALTLAGCGFHLRKPVELPIGLEAIRVVTPSPYSPLGETLTRALQRSGAIVPEQVAPGEKIATLEILSEHWGETPIALDELGRAQEYSLRYAVVFMLYDAAGKEVIPRQVVELSRDFLASPTDAVGRNSERELLEKELRRDMDAAVLRRIDAALRQR